VLGVWLVIGPIGWAGLLVGFPLWTLVTSLTLLRPSAAGHGAEASAGQPSSRRRDAESLLTTRS
jgi:hypothetical protein